MLTTFLEARSSPARPHPPFYGTGTSIFYSEQVIYESTEASENLAGKKKRTGEIYGTHPDKFQRIEIKFVFTYL